MLLQCKAKADVFVVESIQVPLKSRNFTGPDSRMTVHVMS